MATIIILNGISSVGKTTLAKAIQQVADSDFLYVSMDGFIGMLPDGRETDARWFPATQGESSKGRWASVANGPSGAILLENMRRTIEALAESGFDVVVDEVCTATEMSDCRNRLMDHKLHIVKVTADLLLVLRRERERGDRLIGLARDQMDRLHAGIEYDQVVDTGNMTAEGCANAILSRVA